MITEHDILRLGYVRDQRMSDGSIDIIPSNGAERPIKLNLNNEEVTIANESRLKIGLISFSNLEDFTNWHNAYQRPE